MSIFDTDCPECKRRREYVARVAKAMMDWARDPARNPRPGSPEWLEKVGQIQGPTESKKVT